MCCYPDHVLLEHIHTQVVLLRFHKIPTLRMLIKSVDITCAHGYTLFVQIDSIDVFVCIHACVRMGRVHCSIVNIISFILYSVYYYACVNSVSMVQVFGAIVRPRQIPPTR